MADFAEKLAALKATVGKNSRSPLNDPFFAESLIIQSKSIVGRMYSANEYVRFKYECELSQLIKQYRVWLSEVKREEREIANRLDAMKLERREIARERGVDSVELVAKTNREFINHYKRRRNKPNMGDKYMRSGSASSFTSDCGSATTAGPGRSKGKLEKVRLPKIVEKATNGTIEPSTSIRKSTSLPQLAKEERLTQDNVVAMTKDTGKSKVFSGGVVKLPPAGRIEPSQLTGQETGQEKVRDFPVFTSKRAGRVLSAPKSGRERRKLHVTFVARPSSVCDTRADQF